VYVVAGQVAGKTLLPLPVGSDKVEDISGDTDEKYVAMILLVM
jgi:hypothetical protein